jgi:hypothetical protein
MGAMAVAVSGCTSSPARPAATPSTGGPPSAAPTVDVRPLRAQAERAVVSPGAFIDLRLPARLTDDAVFGAGVSTVCDLHLREDFTEGYTGTHVRAWQAQEFTVNNHVHAYAPGLGKSVFDKLRAASTSCKDTHPIGDPDTVVTVLGPMDITPPSGTQDALGYCVAGHRAGQPPQRVGCYGYLLRGDVVSAVEVALTSSADQARAESVVRRIIPAMATALTSA